MASCSTSLVASPNAVPGFVWSDAGTVLAKPVLWMLGLLLFLYVGCELGIWNWLVQHLIAQGIPEARALNVLSLGFALGLVLGRVAVSPILISVKPETVTLAAAILMALTSYLALHARDAKSAWILAFLVGVAMAPVFPTTLAIVGGWADKAIPALKSTAMGFAVSFGWVGMAISSRLIGAIAGGDTRRLRKALLVIPAFSVVMIVLNLAIQEMLS